MPRATCPPQSQVQKAGIVADYDVKLHQGKFYELFYADPLERVRVLPTPTGWDGGGGVMGGWWLDGGMVGMRNGVADAIADAIARFVARPLPCRRATASARLGPSPRPGRRVCRCHGAHPPPTTHHPPPHHFSSSCTRHLVTSVAQLHFGPENTPSSNPRPTSQLQTRAPNTRQAMRTPRQTHLDRHRDVLISTI